MPSELCFLALFKYPITVHRKIVLIIFNIYIIFFLCLHQKLLMLTVIYCRINDNRMPPASVLFVLAIPKYTKLYSEYLCAYVLAHMYVYL